MDIPELIKALDAEIAPQEAELQRLRKKLQLLGELEALEEMKQLRAKATPIAWYVTGCSTMLDEHDAKAEAKRCGGSAKAVPLYTSPPAQQQPDSNKATECVCMNLPDFEKLDRGFRWVSEKQHHVPTLLIEFAPIPANSSATEKGWQDRDAFAAFLIDHIK